MMITAADTLILVDLTDADGHATGRAVPVTVEYLVETERDYGADADGTRGILRTEYTILQVYIEHRELTGLTVAEAEQAIEEAKGIFHGKQKHW